MDIELEIYTILRKHKLTLKKREDVIVDLLDLVEKDRTEQLALCSVSDRRELLITFLMKVGDCYGMDERKKAERCVDEIDSN